MSLAALTVLLHQPDESIPFGSRFAIAHEEMGAIFLAEVFSVGVADPLPMLVRDDVSCRDIVAAHQFRGEPGGAIKGGGARVPAMLAHFDANRLPIAGAFVVGVLTLLVGG